MSQTFTGTGTIQQTGTISWSGGSFHSGLDVLSATLKRSQEVTERVDRNGNTTGLTISPETKWMMDLEIVLKTTTLQLAQDAALLPGPSTVVTLANFVSPTLDTDLLNCANWRVVDNPQVVMSSTEEAKFSLSIIQILGTGAKTATELTTVIL